MKTYTKYLIETRQPDGTFALMTVATTKDELTSELNMLNRYTNVALSVRVTEVTTTK